MSALDIDAAIAAHVTWAKHLDFHLAGIPDDHVDLAQVGDYNHCVLGRWLNGAGQDYGLFSQFHELVEVHKEFHTVARRVVDLADAGRNAEAEALLGGDFRTISRRVVDLLGLLKVD